MFQTAQLNPNDASADAGALQNFLQGGQVQVARLIAHRARPTIAAVPRVATSIAEPVAQCIAKQETLRPGYSGLSQSNLAQNAYELGWDMARHGIRPRDCWHRIADNVMLGFQNGEEHFANRLIKPTAFDKKCLRLRGSALDRGKICDSSVTPAMLKQIAPKHCPVFRTELRYDGAVLDLDTEGDQIWSVDRLHNDGAYIAGNLVIMSHWANQAKNNHDFHSLLAIYKHACTQPDQEFEGLKAQHWGRLAALASLMTSTCERWRDVAELPHMVRAPLGVMQSGALPIAISEFCGKPFEVRQDAFVSWFTAKFKEKHAQRAASDCAVAFVGACHKVRTSGVKNANWIVEDAWASPGFQAFWRKLLDRATIEDFERMVNRAMRPEKVVKWIKSAGMGELYTETASRAHS